MAKASILAGATSQSVNVFIQDSSSTVGAGLSGLVFNTSGLLAYYTFTGANATATAITLATLSAVNSAFSSGGFKEIDATHMKGLYRLDLPNAALAASSGQTVTIYLYGATNMAPCVLEIELTATNNQDGVHGGMSAIPNATAGAANGLQICGSNAPTTYAGSTSTAGLTITGGTTATGALVITGGSTSGAGLSVTTTSGDGLSITPTAGHALTLTGNGTTKHGINATGGSTSSDGIRATGGGTGNGINAQSGSGASGDGIKGVANSTNGNGINLTGNGSAHGMNLTAGATGNGMNVNAGSSSGIGINVSATSGHGIETVGGGIGHGILAGSGPGATGDGILAISNATNGNGLTCTHAGTGKDLNATSTPLTLAKTTNITGLNDIAATAIVSSGAITTSSGKVSEVALVDTVTTVTDLTTTTYSQPGQEAPAATQTLAKMVAYLYKAFRNKVTQTSGTFELFADDSSTVDQKSTTSDDGTTFTRGKIGTGP